MGALRPSHRPNSSQSTVPVHLHPSAFTSLSHAALPTSLPRSYDAMVADVTVQERQAAEAMNDAVLPTARLQIGFGLQVWVTILRVDLSRGSPGSEVRHIKCGKAGTGSHLQ